MIKLTYSEFRPTVNRTSVEVLAEMQDADDILVFRAAILKEIDVCMQNGVDDMARKILEWHREIYDKGLEVGDKMVYHFGGPLDPVGTYELTY